MNKEDKLIETINELKTELKDKKTQLTLSDNRNKRQQETIEALNRKLAEYES